MNKRHKRAAKVAVPAPRPGFGFQQPEVQADSAEQTDQAPDFPALRKFSNPREMSPSELLLLQRTIGNQAVSRLLTKSPARPAPVPALQRTLTLPATDTSLNMETPTAKQLRLAARALERAVSKGLNEDVNAPTSPLAQASAAFKPGVLADSKLSPLWGYTGADDIIPVNVVGPNRLAAQVTNRKATLQHHLAKTLWHELAASTTRRVQKDTTRSIVRLRHKLAKEAAQEGKTQLDNDPKHATMGASLKEYKKLKMDTYLNQVAKQEQLAASITNQVAYKLAKGLIRPDTYPLITQIVVVEKPKRLSELTKQVVEKLQNQYTEKIANPVSSLRRKHTRIKALRQEIIANPTMWNITARKYKKRLLEEFEKLRTKDYQQTLFANIATITADLETTAQTEAKSVIEATKKTTAEELLTKFKAGSKNLRHADNTADRHDFKDRLTARTKKVLRGKQTTVTTKDAAGQDRTEQSTNIVKKAQDKTISEALDGAVHARLGKIAKVIEPLFSKDGDKGKVEFLLKAPVGDPGGGGYVGMRFTGQIEHEIEYDEEKTKQPNDTFMPLKLDAQGKKILKADTFKIKADLAITGGYRVPFVVDIGGEIGGYLESESDKGLARAMELISFGFYRRFRESKVVPHQLTDQMWGLGGGSVPDSGNKSQAKTKEAKAWGKAFQESLSDKELIETGMFGTANASASISGLASFKGGLRGYSGKRYTKQTMQALEKNKKAKQKELTDRGATRERNLGRHMNGAELSFEFGVGPFAIGGKVKGSWLDNQAGDNLDLDLTRKIKLLETELAQPAPTHPDPLEQARLQGLWNTRQQAIPGEITAIKKDRRLLKRQMFSVETEASAASKGGSFANPSTIAAQTLNWAAQVGTKVRSAVVSFKEQYGKDKKGKNIGSSLFASAFSGIDGGVNYANSFNPSTAADKLEKNSKLIETQMGKTLSGASHHQEAIDKLSAFSLKNGGGLKLIFKHSTKRDFASSDEGAKFSKNYPTKVEFIMDAVSGLTFGSQIAAATLEKSTRLFRFGIKYKDGNLSKMTY